ncbi:hypothetical protein AB0P32_28165, partial [Streptomyces sp. NPDC085995]|uniref:hypothetical protein n=1 Tax=Streptomyces sp. NPDC085995 TaxID=3154861 RepID=UPI003420B6C2
RASASGGTTRRRYAADGSQRSALLAGDSVAGVANSVGHGSNCSAIRPAEIRSANFWGWLRDRMGSVRAGLQSERMFWLFGSWPT